MKMHEPKSTTMLSPTTSALAALALAAPLALGCANALDDTGAGEDSADPVATTAEVSVAALRVEQAERLLDRGREVAQAKTLLVEALGLPDITPEERAAALLALSRAHETLGDTEAAIQVLEDEIAANADKRDWPGHDFTKRLRQLLTGAETTPGLKTPSTEPVAPFARVLLDYFPPGADGAVQARMFLAGGDSAVSSNLGTFNLHGALRAKQEQDCPLCDLDVRVSQSVRRSDWLVIPRYQAEFAGALKVFYFDLGDGRIPARYEAHLPMKVEAIVAELEAGKSFVVAAERPGSPPAVLLAAPRAILFPKVEERLADLDRLPTEPVYVDVPLKLRPEEIRAVVRGQWYPHVRRCYEQLLTRSPHAGGKVKAHFEIGAEGKIVSQELDTDDEVLRDEVFQTCVSDSLAKLVFPPTDGRTTVGYPIQLTPN